MSKPIKLYGHVLGPNPWKVAIILEELKIPYETEYMDFSVLKQEPFISLNPNGRTPVIEDPNTGITLWESGAIIDYLVEEYDKEKTLSYTQSPQKYHEKVWEHFQVSGQGPYFGQKAWFTLFHSEKGITSAIERYGNEIKRTLGVIDLHLSKTKQPYLVGDKVSYADLMFVPWNSMVGFLMQDDGFENEWKSNYPKCYEWHQKLVARPAVKKVLDEKAKMNAKN
ncbi:related to theta class glutathione S-transferase [Ramularia collo-cygni]|uniref:glutathione transferase n=1 Tax=Ramularia collo-cygni TaxID=112498 RepID=A0A2D3V648_9PEZI|nr:related to theta class glutathione S-transferase [Ramularia collo-cygni]CZT15773.1 related to theta class glutathione S-transferase [Ramularia collo-cygni]